MITIIKGVFGWTGSGHVQPLSEKDGPVSLPADIERRLVETGVAAYVSDAPAQTAPEPSLPVQSAPAPLPEVDDLPPGAPRYSEDMTKAQLAAVMDAAGVPHSDSMTKSAMLAALDQYYSEG